MYKPVQEYSWKQEWSAPTVWHQPKQEPVGSQVARARVKSKDSPELYAPGTAMSPSVESNYRQQKTMFKEFNLAVTEAVISQNQSSKI